MPVSANGAAIADDRWASSWRERSAKNADEDSAKRPAFTLDAARAKNDLDGTVKKLDEIRDSFVHSDAADGTGEGADAKVPSARIVYTGPRATHSVGLTKGKVVVNSAAPAPAEAKTADTIAKAIPVPTPQAETENDADTAAAATDAAAAGLSEADKRWEKISAGLGLAQDADRAGIMALADDIEALGGSIDDLLAGDFDGIRKATRERAEQLVGRAATAKEGLEVAQRLTGVYEGLRLLETTQSLDPAAEAARVDRVNELARSAGLTGMEKTRLEEVSLSLDTLGLDLDFLLEAGDDLGERLRAQAQGVYDHVGDSYLQAETDARAAALAEVQAAYLHVAERMQIQVPTLLDKAALKTGQSTADAAAMGPAGAASGGSAASAKLDSLLAAAVSDNRAAGGGYAYDSWTAKGVMLQSLFSGMRVGISSVGISVSNSRSSGFFSTKGLSALSRLWSGFLGAAQQSLSAQTLSLNTALSQRGVTQNTAASVVNTSVQASFTATASQTTAAAAGGDGAAGANVSSTSVSASLSFGATSSTTTTTAANSGQTTTVSTGSASIDLVLSLVRMEGFYDPIVLDLAGDGFNFRNAEDGADFDFDGDGTTERAGFVQGDDALLFRATAANGGLAANGLDLFGDAGGHVNGYAALAGHDGNGDGVIDENDDVYGELRLWQDRNGDGVCDGDEVLTLAEAGVRSLNLSHADVHEADEHGNLITQRGSFTRADGAEGAMVDALFRGAR